MKVFILATCRKEELRPYTELVFKTLRVGFPTAEVEVHFNGGTIGTVEKTCDLAVAAGCKLNSIKETTHHDWISGLLLEQNEPFWLVDPDVIFYGKVEHWEFGGPLAGYRIPEFNDPFLKAITRARLHTSLLYVNPEYVRLAWKSYLGRHPSTRFNPAADCVNPLYMPLNRQTIFYDTMALMYHAIGGEQFTPEQKNAYFHFHFGTFSDLVLPSMPDEMKLLRNHVLHQPEAGIGMWRAQDEWFESRQFIQDGENLIAPIAKEDAEAALQWNATLCCGNQAAMGFNDLYYNYCHAIDDILDTMQDGRPRMAKDQIIETFFNAALLYNNDFFVANRTLLLPIILDITSTYAVSVGWEQSPKAHLRKIADVFRTAGNRLYYMVALICGGPAHALKMIRLIHERDYLRQHDANDNPT